MNIRADRARLEAGEQMIGLRFQNHPIADVIQRGFFRRAPPAILCLTALGFDNGIECLLPRPGRDT